MAVGAIDDFDGRLRSFYGLLGRLGNDNLVFILRIAIVDLASRGGSECPALAFLTRRRSISAKVTTLGRQLLLTIAAN